MTQPLSRDDTTPATLPVEPVTAGEERPASDPDLEIDRALESLRDGLDASRGVRRSLEREVAELRERERESGREVERLQTRLDARKAEVESLRTSLDRLREHTLELHRALFEGDLHDLLLRASIAVTGAARGGYFELAGGKGDPRLVTELDIDLEEGEPVPGELCDLARRCLDDNRSARVDDPAGETYACLLGAPVTLTGEPSGVVVVADKPGGFTDADTASLVSIGDQAVVAADNRRLQQRLQRVHLETIGMLADLAESKDPYTSGHCEQVAGLAMRLGRRLGLGRQDLQTVCYAALLHDVGKVAVSDVILKKREPLQAEEMELVRSHVRIGHGLLARVPLFDGVADGVLHHHERWDGDGYPDGLAGDDIPLPARVVAVADAYCAMLDERVYKAAMTEDEAKAELRRCAGSQFDPQVVETLLELLEEDPEGSGLDLEGFDYLHGAPSRGKGLGAAS